MGMTGVERIQSQMRRDYKRSKESQRLRILQEQWEGIEAVLEDDGYVNAGKWMLRAKDEADCVPHRSYPEYDDRRRFYHDGSGR